MSNQTKNIFFPDFVCVYHFFGYLYGLFEDIWIGQIYGFSVVHTTDNTMNEHKREKNWKEKKKCIENKNGKILIWRKYLLCSYTSRKRGKSFCIQFSLFFFVRFKLLSKFVWRKRMFFSIFVVVVHHAVLCFCLLYYKKKEMITVACVLLLLWLLLSTFADCVREF